MGQRVKLFTASGTFKGEEGTAEIPLPDGSAWVRLDSDGRRMLFAKREMIPVEESSRAVTNE